MVSALPRTAGDFHIYAISSFWDEFDRDYFFLCVLFSDPPVSEDKSEKDLDDVVVFDSLVAMDTG